jgi:hypothetical protein
MNNQTWHIIEVILLVIILLLLLVPRVPRR